jgi:hypothetical protein
MGDAPAPEVDAENTESRSVQRERGAQEAAQIRDEDVNTESRSVQRERGAQEAAQIRDEDVRREEAAYRQRDWQMLLSHAQNESRSISLDRFRSRNEAEKLWMDSYREILNDEKASEEEKEEARQARRELIQSMRKRVRLSTENEE